MDFIEPSPLPQNLSDIAETLEDESFPLDKESLYYAIGDIFLQTPKGDFIAARELLDEVEQEHFASLTQIIEALAAALSNRGA